MQNGDGNPERIWLSPCRKKLQATDVEHFDGDDIEGSVRNNCTLTVSDPESCWDIIESFSGSKSFSLNWQLTRVDHKLASAQKANLLFLRSKTVDIFLQISFINIS